jgi:hypothetical protein
MPDSNFTYRELQDVYQEWQDGLPEESDSAQGQSILNEIYKEKDKAFQKIESMNLRKDEMWRRKAQWLRDDMRRMKRLRADAEVDIDELIRELDDKTRNPKKRFEPDLPDKEAMAKKRQEAVDRLGGKDEYDKELERARNDLLKNYDKWLDYAEKDDEARQDFQVKVTNKEYSGQINAIEGWDLFNQWLRDDMRRMDRLRADQDVDMDEIIRDLDDKTRNPKKCRKPNPPDDEARGKGRQAAEARINRRREAIDRLGGYEKWKEYQDRAQDNSDKRLREWNGYEERDSKGFIEIVEKLMAQFNSGEIDIIEYTESFTQWLLDDMRRMDRERAERTDRERAEKISEFHYSLDEFERTIIDGLIEGGRAINWFLADAYSELRELLINLPDEKKLELWDQFPSNDWYQLNAEIMSVADLVGYDTAEAQAIHWIKGK